MAHASKMETLLSLFQETSRDTLGLKRIPIISGGVLTHQLWNFTNAEALVGTGGGTPISHRQHIGRLPDGASTELSMEVMGVPKKKMVDNGLIMVDNGLIMG